MEAARTEIEVGDGGRRERVVEADNSALTPGVLAAAIFAEASAERILRQTEHLPIAEAAKEAAVARDVHICAGYVFIDIAAGAGCLGEIVQSPGVGGKRNQVQQESRCWVDSTCGDHITRKRAACAGREIYRQRVIDWSSGGNF